MLYIKTLMNKLKGDNRGVAYLEFFLVLPILLLLIVGAVDITRMVLIHQKIDRVAFTVADVVTRQGTNFNNACPLLRQLDGTVVRDIIKPFDFENRFSMSVTSVVNSNTSGIEGNGTPVVEWEYESPEIGGNECGGGATLNQFMSANQISMNPTGANIRFAGLERVIVSETFYQFKSFVPGLDTMINTIRVRGAGAGNCLHFNKRFIMRARNTNPRDADGTFGSIQRCS